MTLKTRQMLFATIIVVFGMLGLWSSLAAAAEFQADVTESREVVIRKGHIWFKDGVYRLQMKHPGDPDHYLLVNTATHITRMVFPKYKAYLETSGDDFMILMNEDPFQAAELNAKGRQVKVEGRETLDGINCERQLVLLQGKGVMRRWMSPELGFPVKIDALLQDDWYTELHHIKRTRVDEHDLQIPAAYAQKTQEELAKLFEADPEAVARKEAYRKNRPRKSELNDFLSAGETWNLVLQPGTRIRLEAKPIGPDGPRSWFAVPYKGQKPLKPLDQCTHQGQGKVTFDPKLGLDGVALGVNEGQISLKVVLIGTLPQVQAMRSVHIRAQHSGSNWGVHGPYQLYQVQIRSIQNHQAGVRFKAAGKTHDLKIPTGQQREFTFRPQDKVRDLDLTVDYGTVEVRCIQDNRARPAPHVLLGLGQTDAPLPDQEEALHAACLNDKRPPWCFEKKIVAMQKPELCADITRYWGANAGGVEGYCYYEIAKKTHECSLCKKIKDGRLRRNLCERDVCRKRTGSPSGSASTSKK